jgi:hypothetical protein
MSQNPEHEPAKQPPVLRPWAEPGIAPESFFTISGTSSGDMVPYLQTPLAREQEPWPPPPPQAGLVARPVG